MEDVPDGILKKGRDFRFVEPSLYSVYESENALNSYDSGFGNIYDTVACNSLYNRIAWGYSIDLFSQLANKALYSSGSGFILDAGCGSLAFTAKVYAEYRERPVVLLDQSLKLLRMAKKRLMDLVGHIPENLLFLHGDATALPFQDHAFDTLLSLNLLHVLPDQGSILRELHRVIARGGNAFFSTLVENERLSDHYLRYCERLGEAYSRTIPELVQAFHGAGMDVRMEATGNMCLVYYNS